MQQENPSPSDRDEFDRAADLLSTQVAEFEALVAALPYRIAYEYHAGDEALSLHRTGGAWQFTYRKRYAVAKKGMARIVDPFDGYDFKWEDTPLKQCSLSVKARAVMMFGKFLEGMAAEYDRTREAVVSANAEFEHIQATMKRLASAQEGA